MVRLLPLILLAGLTPITGQAREGDELRDWREECRSALAGRYMNQRNERDLAVRTVASLRQNARQLAKAREDTASELKKLQATMAERSFEARLQEQETGLKDRLKLTDDQIAANAERLKAEEDALKNKDAALNDLTKRLKGVFQVKEEGGDTKGDPTLVTLAYINSCPPFRVVCPLPDGAKKSLHLNFPDLPESCRRYIQIN